MPPLAQNHALGPGPVPGRCGARRVAIGQQPGRDGTVQMKRLFLTIFLILAIAMIAPADPILPYALVQAGLTSWDCHTYTGCSRDDGSIPNTVSNSDSLDFSLTARYASYSVFSYGGSAPEVGIALTASGGLLPEDPGTYTWGGGAYAIAQNFWSFIIQPKGGFSPSETTGTLVPIDFAYTINLYSAGEWGERAQIFSDFFGAKSIEANNSGASSMVNTSHGSHVESYGVAYNQWHNVSIILEGQIWGTTPTSAFIGGIDPGISLGADWLASHPNDEIIFSSVAPAAGAAPEPSTALLLFTGIGGAMLLRKRR